MPDGQLFHLSYFLGRASYARDMTRRRLLSSPQEQDHASPLHRSM
jgi:hypothetical protein